jgi:glutamate-5-semialdehyde dehydrogenase
MIELATRAREASRRLRTLTTRDKNVALLAMAESLREHRAAIETANEHDRRADMPAPKKDRLRVDVDAIARSLDAIAKLPDPVGGTELRKPEGGFRLERRRVPLGVILMIFESRPNVTPEAGALCLKSGNASILKGGSEARYTNEAMMRAMEGTFPPDAIQLVSGGHEEISELLGLDELIDVVIPRGGEGLIRAVTAQSKIPVLKHYRGNCHVYVDADADLEMAYRIVENSKCQRPATCNAAEKVLVHRDVAKKFVPRLAELGVELRGDRTARELTTMKPATEQDWPEEYLDLVLGVKVVDDVGEAIDHIERYGSHHTDAIVTDERATAERFLEEVDSATVLWNASTRIADGGLFGLGAEVGISTDKLHARGPMGLEELTTYKWVVEGHGDLRR